MHTKTMEGLVGARTNMDLMNTSMRVYREAKRKGDPETMKRAMGYANECSDKAEEYKAEADKGMEEDAKEAREKAKVQREEAVQKRREEREKLEERIEANTDTKETSACLQETKGCFLEISEEGKVLLKDSTGLDDTVSAETKTDAVREPVIYTKTGETVSAEQSTNTSISVSV